MGLLSATAKKRSPYLPEITSSNADVATAICAREPRVGGMAYVMVTVANHGCLAAYVLYVEEGRFPPNVLCYLLQKGPVYTWSLYAFSLIG